MLDYFNFECYNIYGLSKSSQKKNEKECNAVENQLKFNSIIQKMRYGLVRLTPEFRIIDKNKVADLLFDLPKRNSSVIRLLENPAELEALRKEKGAALTCRLRRNGKTVGAVAIREKSGNVLLFFHPLLTAVCSDKNSIKVQKILKYYGKYILDIIYQASGGEGIYTVKSVGISDSGYFINFGEERSVRLSEGLKAVARKLSVTDFKNNVTVLVENNTDCVFKCVNFNTLMYVVTEQMALLSSVGLGINSKVHIYADTNFLYVTVEDRMKEIATKADEYFARIFVEIIHLLKVYTDVKFKRDTFESTVAIPISEFSYKLREIPVTTEGEYWGYYAYCLDFWNMGFLTE